MVLKPLSHTSLRFLSILSFDYKMLVSSIADEATGDNYLCNFGVVSLICVVKMTLLLEDSNHRHHVEIMPESQLLVRCQSTLNVV